MWISAITSPAIKSLPLEKFVKRGSAFVEIRQMQSNVQTVKYVNTEFAVCTLVCNEVLQNFRYLQKLFYVLGVLNVILQSRQF